MVKGNKDTLAISVYHSSKWPPARHYFENLCCNGVPGGLTFSSKLTLIESKSHHSCLSSNLTPQEDDLGVNPCQNDSFPD